MTEQNALRHADQALSMLKKHRRDQAIWVIGDNVQRTPNTDFDVEFMTRAGAKLAGVFNERIGRRDLAEAIVAA